MSLSNEFSILIQLSIFVTNHCFVAPIRGSYHNKGLNSVYDFDINHGFDKYDKSDNCEIRIVTSGVCSVNNHLVKPTITFKHTSKFNQIPGKVIFASYIHAQLF